MDTPSYDGNTALHIAVASNKLGITALLMAANANPDLENEEPEEEYITEDDDDDDDADEDESNTETDGDAVESAEDETPPGITPKDLAQGNPKVSATSLV